MKSWFFRLVTISCLVLGLGSLSGCLTDSQDVYREFILGQQQLERLRVHEEAKTNRLRLKVLETALDKIQIPKVDLTVIGTPGLGDTNETLREAREVEASVD